MSVKKKKDIEGGQESGSDGHRSLYTLDGMYEDYFLDYASYVILERAVPAVEDGLKPVQRRILHSMRKMHDGRYHKVANIIGQTMQYHPHGDAAIGDALVNLGQRELLIDTQGNWGDVRTGDSAAASRYIEARLTPFALEVAFNSQTTEWQLSYDGRNEEPIHLPMKFPLVLALGAEGIAVGLATRVMPHNFMELIDASIKCLQGKRFKLYPDFLTGGLVDVSDYQDGERGGRIRVRARIEQLDKKALAIRELPYGVTTTSLIDSIIKAADKGKIKIKRLVDNTAKDVEIQVELQPGTSPELTMDALYAFTHCEVSISPNACVIVDNKPAFLSAKEILEISTENTKELLRRELEIKEAELLEKWHFSSLEKIFIEKRIYRDIEECESFDEVLEVIREGLEKYVATPETKKSGDKRLLLHREITEEDIVRLTEIRIKRISKYNSFKADELIVQIENDLDQIRHDLKHLTDFAIAYFKRLLEKYGAGKERRTEITAFDTIQAQQVIASNAKLYVNYREGFIGYGLKKDEFLMECSDIDDIITLRRDGSMSVTRIADKVFVGKDILHAAVWKKGDDRTTYNMVYVDGKSGNGLAKRFNVTAVTRDKNYRITTDHPKSKVLYLSANPNGESEVVEVQLTPGSKARKKIFDFDFAELDIKGRGVKGNIVTKYPVRKIIRKEVGKSTLGAQKYWMDEVSGRLNTEERGKLIGAFDTGDLILSIHTDGSYALTEPSETTRHEVKELLWIGKYNPEMVISAVYFEPERGWTMVKRFQIETSTTDQKFMFIPEEKGAELYYATPKEGEILQYVFKSKNKKIDSEIDLDNFIEVKGWKSLGNRLIDRKLLFIQRIDDGDDNDDREDEEPENNPTGGLSGSKTPELFDQSETEVDKPEKSKRSGKPSKSKNTKAGGSQNSGKYSTGDTIEFDL